MRGPAPPTQLAHALWRKLPPGLRRRAYEAITARLATGACWSDATPRSPEPPYLVAGPLSAPTGLGQAARLVVAALLATGREVSVVDLGPGLMQPSLADLPPLPPPRAGRGTLVLMSQPPNVPHALALIGRDLLRDKLRVGLWAWELDRLPRSWRQSRRFVHALAAPSRYCQAVYAAAFSEAVRYAPYPIAAAPIVRRERGRADDLTVFGAALDLGSTAARKNPLTVVEAYRRAFGAGDPVRLDLKVRAPTADRAAFAALERERAAPGAPIELRSRDLDACGLDAWYRGLDVLVSLHRSEGFGLVPAEAMQRGLPAISTDWSATAEFVTAATGWPVSARAVPARDATGRYELPGATWGEPDLTSAVAALREAAADPAGRLRRGIAAAAAIERRFSASAFVAGLEAPSA